MRHGWRLLAWCLLTVCLAPRPAAAQSYPFPTSGHYAQGYVPTAATAAAALSSYNSWKSHYLMNDCGGTYYRVDNGSGNASTFSEGQGYGMVLTAYFGDRAQFDGLWAFAQHNSFTNGSADPNGLMGWHVTCAGPTTCDGGAGSATDGDTDVAFGLIVAAAQWGGTYLQEARTYLAALKAGDFTTCASPPGRAVPTAGNWQGPGNNDACTTGGGGSNTSYWMPAYYRVFQAVTGDAYWGQAANDVVTLYGLAADPTTGIIVNEVDQNGAAVPGQTYDYNSCRIPWRAMLDYLWNGTPAVQQFTTRLSTWVNTVGIQQTVDGYNANGTATGQYTGLNAFVGGFSVGAMADSASLSNSFGSYFVSIADDNGGYYGASLRTLYLLALSGNQWNPSDVLNMSTDAGTPPPPDAGTSPGNDGGGSTHDAGGRGSDSGPTVDEQADGGSTTTGHSGGCSCNTVPVRDGRSAMPTAALVAMMLLLARRRAAARGVGAHDTASGRIDTRSVPARCDSGQRHE